MVAVVVSDAVGSSVAVGSSLTLPAPATGVGVRLEVAVVVLMAVVLRLDTRTLVVVLLLLLELRVLVVVVTRSLSSITTVRVLVEMLRPPVSRQVRPMGQQPLVGLQRVPGRQPPRPMPQQV